MADNPQTPTSNAASNIAKFQSLLRELFQFDCADLDFGIYRIMNHKRDVIEKFITEQLPNTVAAELNRGPLAQQVQADAALENARQQVEATLGSTAFDAHGQLSDTFRDTPLGRQYLDAQAQAVDGTRSRAAVEADIYNHLYTFFSRYYQDGDFISKRRYARNERYAIPYNGEEVHLYWANRDQYYVKTTEHFYNYDWNAPGGVAVRFRVKAADVEQNNVKGDKRFFIPLVAETKWDADALTVTIPFEYRPLTPSEQVRYGNSNQQDKIIAASCEALPNQLHEATEAIAALTGERRRKEKGESISHLEHHLRQYTRRNNSDFFIHKDLPGFLSRELDFYLKNEVLNLNDIANAGLDMAEGWFQQMRLIKAVGSQIIDFLAQIEGFQKRLWEKRKFVTETQYCICLGCIDPSFYPDIADNNSQWEEWQELYDIDGNDRSAVFLQAHPTLVLDTAHFDDAFIDRLLTSFDDLDGMTDGLLIHGENWQALHLIKAKYSKTVQCLYIDPPYNTGDSEILYKNGYLRSSWLSLIENRLLLTIPLLSDDPVLFVAIDDFQMVDLCKLIDENFSSLRRETIIVNHHPQGGKASTLSSTHEYMITCVNKISGRILSGRMENSDVEERPFKRSGTAESNFRYARPNSFYAILVDTDTNIVVGLEPPPDINVSDYPTENTEDGYIRIYPLGSNNEERVWRRSYESCHLLVQSSKLKCSSGKTIYQLIDADERTAALFSNWVDSRYNAGTFGANLLGHIIGRHNPFPYPKSVHTVSDAIFAARVGRNAHCADYFAGSGTTGHAVINLNREDGGQRKFILVEMGEYFDTVLLPRIKKVTFSPEWKDGKPQRAVTPEEAERSPRVIKYTRLESYDETLDSIEFDDADGQLRLEERFDDYLLTYMLHWETKASATLLNVSKMTTPFTYRLRVHVNGNKRERTVDLPETFNYLLGLNVHTRRTYNDRGRRYLVYRGNTQELPGHNVAVIWRETDGWSEQDFTRDRQFVGEQQMTEDGDTVYVNGDSCIPQRQSNRTDVQSTNVRRRERLKARTMEIHRCRARAVPINPAHLPLVVTPGWHKSWFSWIGCTSG